MIRNNDQVPKPVVAFPSSKVLSELLQRERPDLLRVFRKSGAKRVLGRSRFTVQSHLERFSLAPIVSFLETDPDLFVGLLRQWISTTETVDLGTVGSMRIEWSVGDNSVPTRAPFSVAEWLRFVCSVAPDGSVLDAPQTELACGLRLGLSVERSSALATKRSVVPIELPLLALAVRHLNLSVQQCGVLSGMFDSYLSMLSREGTSQNVYDAFRSSSVDYFSELSSDVDGVVEDVPAWLMFSCVTSCDKKTLIDLFESRVNPVDALRLWFVGFDFPAVVAVLVNDIDFELASTIFSPRYGVSEFDCSATGVVRFS
jgi:hypothetical protein